MAKKRIDRFLDSWSKMTPEERATAKGMIKGFDAAVAPTNGPKPPKHAAKEKAATGQEVPAAADATSTITRG